MTKKKLSYLIILLILITVACVTIFLSNEKRWSDYAVDEEKYNELKQQRSNSSERLIDSINFNGYELIFDSYKNRWFYSQIENDGKATTNPRVKIKPTSGNVKIAVVNADIKCTGTKFIAYTDGSYEEYELVSTTLPIMELNCDEMPKASNKENVDCKMRLFDNRKSATQRVTESIGTMHVRGNSTRNQPKNSFKLNLRKQQNGSIKNNHVSLLGMREDDDWILYSAYSDHEKVRNVFSSNLWYEACANNNSFGLNNGMQYKFIELIINGEYYGLYALGYPIDKKVLDLKASQDATTCEYSYKKVDWTPENEINLYVTDDSQGYEITSPVDNFDENLELKPLRYYYQTISLLQEGQGALLYNQIDKYNAIDIYLFVLMIQGEDHVHGYALKNLFITAKHTQNGHVMLYTPWDMDITWGCHWFANNTIKNYIYKPQDMDSFIMKSSPVGALLKVNDPLIRSLISQRYSELRQNEWSEEKINKMLDEYERDIFGSGAFARDKERWPEGNYSEEEQGLSVFRQYVHDRLKAMDEYVGGI